MPPRRRLTLEGARRRAQVVALRQQGLTFAEIGKQLGITGQRAGQIFHAALVGVPRQAVEEHRATELLRLDRLHASVWSAATGGDIRAIEICLRVSAHRCRLLGLDAPNRHDELTLDQLDAQIAKLNAELDANDTGI